MLQQQESSAEPAFEGELHPRTETIIKLLHGVKRPNISVRAEKDNVVRRWTEFVLRLGTRRRRTQMICAAAP